MQYNISPSASVSSQVSLSTRNITTLDFNQIVPVHSLECIIGDKHHISINQFTRCSPLVVPTYGNFKLGYVSFFVPYYQVFSEFDSFYSGLNSIGASSIEVPFFTIQTLVSAFANDSLSSATPSGSKPDFIHYGTTGSVNKRTLNASGRYIYKVLQLLGYSFVESMQVGSTISNTRLSALPLLCFLKAFNDWMSLSSIYDRSVLTDFLRKAKSGGSLSSPVGDLLVQLPNILRPLVGSDFFTSAYNTYSFASNQSSFVSRGFKDTLNRINSSITSTSDFSTNDNLGVYTQLATSNGLPALSTRQLKFLQSFDKFLRRNELSGTRAAQRIFARFGLKSEDFRSNYAQLLASKVIDFDVADVTSTSPNSDPSLGLGTYSGQSVSAGDFTFDLECSDFGHVITFAYIDVNSQYINTISPEVLRRTALDFYQPDFDGVGFQPICYAQLYNNPSVELTSSNIGHINPLDSIFGFQPRYEEYRTSYSRVTGDFVHLDTMDSWHFARKLDSTQGTPTFGNLLPQSHAFQFSDEWRRIFTSEVIPEGFDHFFSAFNIDVNSTRRIKSRAGSIDLPDGQLSVSSLGRTVQQS